MEFDIQLDANGGFLGLQFRTPKMGSHLSGDFTYLNDCYGLYINSGAIGLRFNANVAPVASANINVMDGQVHVLGVTITDTDAGVQIDVEVDGAVAFSYLDEAKTCGPEQTGIAIHDACWAEGVVTYTLTDKGVLSNPPAEDVPQMTLAEAIADTANWTLQNMEATALGANGVFSFSNSGTAAQKVALYRGNFVQSGKKMEFEIQMDANGGFVGLQFRTGNALGNWLDGDYTYQNDCYAVDIRPGVVGLRTNAGSAPLASANINVMDGQIHVLGVTITDIDAGVQIDVEVDGVQAYSYLDESKLCGPENTGFAVHDACWSTETVTYTIADKGAFPRDYADNLADATADTDKWYYSGLDVSALAGGKISYVNSGMASHRALS